MFQRIVLTQVAVRYGSNVPSCILIGLKMVVDIRKPPVPRA